MVSFSHSNNSTFLVPIFCICYFTLLWSDTWHKQLKGKKDLLWLKVSETSVHHARESSSHYGGQEAEMETGRGHGQGNSQGPVPSDTLPSARTHLLRFPESPKIAPPAGDQAEGVISHSNHNNIHINTCSIINKLWDMMSMYTATRYKDYRPYEKMYIILCWNNMNYIKRYIVFICTLQCLYIDKNWKGSDQNEMFKL
jgi:hypothetical protein